MRLLSYSYLRPMGSAALLIFSVCLLSPTARAQSQQPSPEPPAEEVIRVSTELVQTDLMVFDKQGRFVDNLGREEFELRVDGKPQSILFFEKVVAGSTNEEALLAAARGIARAETGTNPSSSIRPLDRGRTIFFFVDDIHMSPESLNRTRRMLQHFVENSLGQNDQIAITSATGQIGFLQQLTDNKTVLTTAINRLKYRSFDVRDIERPVLPVYQALEIVNRNQGVLDFYVEAMIKDNPGMRPEQAAMIIQSRASILVRQSDALNKILLESLSSLVQSTGRLPGRKLVFLISDGFLINLREGDTTGRMRRLTDAAARSGVVIYSIDARGLATTADDAASDRPFDPGMRLASTSSEFSATQQPLNALAADTGGRAFFNRNVLEKAVAQTLKETSVYYLLAWRPEGEPQRPGRFRRIEARIKGRPDLLVRMRKGYLEAENVAATTTAQRPPKPDAAATARASVSETELRKAINAAFPVTALPTSLFAYYTETANLGTVLTVLMAVSTNAVQLEAKESRQMGSVEVSGLVFNDEGKAGANFNDRLLINIAPAELQHLMARGLSYNYQIRIKPGLYQVRVAARDAVSGRTGSATQWIEIPDLSTNKLALSSLLLGERRADDQNGAQSSQTGQQQPQSASMAVSRRFTRSSRLRFLTYIYHAARGANGGAAAAPSPQPDLAFQVQVFREDQPVVTTSLRKISTEGMPDPARLPFAAEVPLSSLPVGEYLLRVTVIDRVAKTSASQQVSFTVE